MNKKLTALLTTAVVSGLIASQSAKADDQKPTKEGESVSDDKPKCSGMAAKEGDDMNPKEKKKKGNMGKKGKKGKNGCNNGCGGNGDKKK